MLLRLLKKILVSVGLKHKKRSYDEAVKLADKTYAKTGQKCLVFYSGGEFKMITKRGIRNGKKNGFFKGLSYADIEKRALYAKG